jgi:hypothetical protein
VKGAIGFKKATSEMDVTDAPELAASIRGTGMKASITSKEYPVVILYDKWGQARKVPSGTGNVERCLKADPPLYAACPLCHGEHEGPDLSRCPALPEPIWEACPFCGKKIVDDRPLVVKESMPLAAGEIRPEGALTPGQRVHNRWQTHMAIKHPDYAISYGIDVEAIRSRFQIQG